MRHLDRFETEDADRMIQKVTLAGLSMCNWWCCLLAGCILLTGCQRDSRSCSDVALRGSESEHVEVGAVSTAPVAPTPTSPGIPEMGSPFPTAAVDWSPLMLTEASVGVSCNLDYQQDIETPVIDFSRETLQQVLSPCKEPGLVKLSYRGKINRDFGSVIERVTVTAGQLGIDRRVLDINSVGGQIEDAIRTGDFIAESHWTLWVREGAICHSACVLILGAGDTRMIAGEVGIHRIIRMSSTARTRAELNAELNAVYGRVRDYLARNGVALAVADLMMAVPNRRLRVLTGEELRLFGLDGANPVQDDLDRLRLMRKCGEDFVKRRDAFMRAFELRCTSESDEIDALKECGLALRTQFGFPDSACADESPLSEFDIAVAAKKVRKPALLQGSSGGDSREPVSSDPAR